MQDIACERSVASGEHHEQQSRQTRRHEIGDIVDARGGPAKGLVPLGAVADHGIERVDRLVADDAGQPEQRAPEHRRDDAVGGIFGEALDRGARDAGLVELVRGSRPTIIATFLRAASNRRRAGDRGRQRHDHRASGTRQRARPGFRAKPCRSSPAGIIRCTIQPIPAASAITNSAAATPAARRSKGASVSRFQLRVQRGDQSAEPGDGMADARKQARSASPPGRPPPSPPPSLPQIPRMILRSPLMRRECGSAQAFLVMI